MCVRACVCACMRVYVCGLLQTLFLSSTPLIEHVQEPCSSHEWLWDENAQEDGLERGETLRHAGGGAHGTHPRGGQTGQIR